MTAFAGQVALVTGGASGIGAATARRLAAEGCRVVIADLQADMGQAVAHEIGGRFSLLDVTDSAAWSACLDDIAAHEGVPRLVHLNAGVTTGENELDNLTDDQFARVVTINVGGVVFGTRAVAPRMAEGSSIIVTASMAGLISFAPDPIYTLTKHAVIGFVRSIAPQLELRRITINAICPGIVDTPLLGDDAKARVTAAGIPLIPASEIAGAVVGAIQSGRTGEAWMCLPNRAPQVYPFPELPLGL